MAKANPPVYVIAYQIAENDQGWVHFDEKEKAYIIKRNKIGSCVWKTREKANDMIQKCNNSKLTIEEFVPDKIILASKTLENNKQSNS
jgi:hypothetical protein